MTRLEDLTEQEIARRLPVWTALADLTLEPEPLESAVRHAVRVMREAGYTLAEAESILRYEVAPAFWFPLDDTWGLWQEDDVREKVLTRLGKFRLWERIPFWRDLWYRCQQWNVKKAWMRVKAQFAAEASA